MGTILDDRTFDAMNRRVDSAAPKPLHASRVHDVAQPIHRWEPFSVRLVRVTDSCLSVTVPVALHDAGTTALNRAHANRDRRVEPLAEW